MLEAISLAMSIAIAHISSDVSSLLSTTSSVIPLSSFIRFLKEKPHWKNPQRSFTGSPSNEVVSLWARVLPQCSSILLKHVEEIYEQDF
jgi:hypothetical protein